MNKRTFTAEGLELFTLDGMLTASRKASRKITSAYNKSMKARLTEFASGKLKTLEAVGNAVWNDVYVVMSEYSDTGATDSEPYYHVKTAIINDLNLQDCPY
jgi:hypothetical protein